MTDERDYTTRTVDTPGNVAGWAGVAFTPLESDDVTMKEDRLEYWDYVIRGLLPYEAVTVTVVAESSRVEFRLVANDAGVIRLNTNGATAVPDDHDPALSVKVGDHGEIEFEGAFIEQDL